MATTTPPPPPQAPAQGPPPQKKKTSPLVWVLVGCGGILVILFIVLGGLTFWAGHKIKNYAEEAKKNPAMAAAKAAIAFTPDLEVVSEDDAHNTLTVRNKKTGEVITMDAADIKNGRLKFRNEKGEEVTFQGSGEKGKEGFTVKSKEGEVSFGQNAEVKLPSWVPLYPGAKPTGSLTQHKKGSEYGSYMFTTDESADKVVGYYQQELESNGFTVEKKDLGGTPAGLATLNAKADGGRREVNVSAVPIGNTVQVTVQYNGPGE
jgi:hypothetical protein